MRLYRVKFQSRFALNKAAVTSLNKDKAVRAHKGGVSLGYLYPSSVLGSSSVLYTRPPDLQTQHLK